MAKAMKGKKKKWYPVIAPKLFNNVVIGETFVLDPNLVVGRRMKANLSSITGNMRHQSLNISFKITGVKDNKAETQATGIEMSPASIKRIVRRNTNRMDSSFTAETSDKKKIRIKPLLLTRYKTKGTVVKALRAELEKGLVAEINKMTYDNMFKALVSHSLQRDMKTKLKKIYPLRTLEIKKLILEEGSEALEAKEKPNAKEEKKDAGEKEQKEKSKEQKEGVKKEEIKKEDVKKEGSKEKGEAEKAEPKEKAKKDTKKQAKEKTKKNSKEKSQNKESKE